MSRTCPRCGGRMEQGFIPEARDSSGRVATWYEGTPRRWLGLLRLRGRRHMTVETWRCSRCSVLESFAPER